MRRVWGGVTGGGGSQDKDLHDQGDRVGAETAKARLRETVSLQGGVGGHFEEGFLGLPT